MKSEITSSLNVMKNETLYNLSLESPLLRDADILDHRSIATTWRGISLHYIVNIDASFKKRDVLREWVIRRIGEGEELSNSAEKKLQVIGVFKEEGQALYSLGENVL
jgi:hypothetical protein